MNIEQIVRESIDRGVDSLPESQPTLPEVGTPRRRRMAPRVAVTALGTAAVIVASLAVVQNLQDRDKEPPTAYSAAAYRDEGALAVDGRLYIGGKKIPFDETVKSFYYTSAGVVVRSGESPWTDAPDVDHHTLLRPDGSRQETDINVSDQLIGTEMDSTRVAVVEPDGRAWQVVVTDVNSGEELARVDIPQRKFTDGWDAPPAAIDGDRVWVDFDNGMTEVNWRTGETRKVPGTANVGQVANGRYLVSHGKKLDIRNMSDGSLVRRIQLRKPSFGRYSPDGRYISVTPLRRQFTRHVVDATTEQMNRLPREARLTPGYGWTPDGNILTIDDLSDGTVVTCAPITGECKSTGLKVDLKFKRKELKSVVKLGGNTYES